VGPLLALTAFAAGKYRASWLLGSNFFSGAFASPYSAMVGIEDAGLGAARLQTL
jgi:hypothetical protein